MDEGQSRGRLISVAVLGGLMVVLIAVALLSGGGDPAEAGLRVQPEGEPGTAAPGITVYVNDPAANVPDTAAGKARVVLECLDSGGRQVVRAAHPWPFTDTDDGTFDPHVHQRVNSDQLGRLVSCRLEGTDGPLEGRLGSG
jgi:hypothetical protein